MAPVPPKTTAFMPVPEPSVFDVSQAQDSEPASPRLTADTRMSAVKLIACKPIVSPVSRDER